MQASPPDQLEQALQSLQAALFGGEFYEPSHPSVVQQLDHAHRTLTLALSQSNASEPQRTVVRNGSRLLCDGRPIHDPRGLCSKLFDRLARIGVDGLTFRSGIAIHDLQQLLAWMHPSGGAAQGWSGTPCMTLVRVTLDAIPDKHSDTAVATPQPITSQSVEPSAQATLAEPLQVKPEQLDTIWRAVGEANANTLDLQTTQAVLHMLAGMAGSSSSLLPLAQMKRFDEYTYTHTVNVAMLAAALAEVVGFKPQHVRDLTLAAVLHDVGKRLTPTEILNKPGKLTTEERDVIRRHAVDGARMLFATPDLPDIVPIVAFEHHLYLDGSGYPLHHAHTKPHLASQIVQIADVFDALCTDRPYRPAMQLSEAADYIESMAGKLFNPALTQLFLEHVTPRAKAA